MKGGKNMTLEKREYPDNTLLRSDKCQTHCNNMGGGESNFNTAHGQQETQERQKKNQPSLPC